MSLPATREGAPRPASLLAHLYHSVYAESGAAWCLPALLTLHLPPSVTNGTFKWMDIASTAEKNTYRARSLAHT